MKHRLVNNGLGANAKVYLNNRGSLNERFTQAVLEFLGLEGGDFQVEKDSVSVGIEPTYQYQDLKIVTIAKNKNESTYTTGRAWGPYGSGIASKTRRYGSYKNKSRFTKFVDEWHPFIWSSK